MDAIVEAIDVVTGNSPSAPISLTVAPDEIVALLFPPNKPHLPILRALAGLDAAAAGEVRFPGRRRILLAAPGQSLSDALSARPDLVLLDAANDVADHGTWVRIASERARGTSFVVATSIVDQACRGDRISLASWDMADLTCALQDLLRQMNGELHEFLGVLGEGRHRRTGSMAGDLRRHNAGARAILGEMRRRVGGEDERLALQTAAEQVAGAAVSDRLLDAVIAEQDR